MRSRRRLTARLRPSHGERQRLTLLAVPPARSFQPERLAHDAARLGGQDAPDAGTGRHVSRSGEGAGLASLAHIVTEGIPDDALVLNPELRAALDRLLARCHQRDGLARELGAAASTRYTAGVRALFVGPSGTGKTLAACWLAKRLQLPLYRVDLANINSKYIGETEKNLARLFERAERTEAVLLFDEADSLFGNRTDGRDANDRFANAPINYLLQRIETFDRIAILTSNSRTCFDPLFLRRMDLIIEFPTPAAAERTPGTVSPCPLPPTDFGAPADASPPDSGGGMASGKA